MLATPCVMFGSLGPTDGARLEAGPESEMLGREVRGDLDGVG
jgi:hypothetical protein